MNPKGLVSVIDDFDGVGSTAAGAVVDFAEIEQGFLNGASASDAAVFDDAPEAAIAAVLESFVRTQKHDPAWSMPRNSRACLWSGSPPQALSEGAPCKIKGSSALEGRSSTFFTTNS